MVFIYHDYTQFFVLSLEIEKLCQHTIWSIQCARFINLLPFKVAYTIFVPCTCTYRGLFFLLSGEIGIRTPGTSRFNSFQDCRNRPLCHFSVDRYHKINMIKIKKIILYYIYYFFSYFI
jgi:hypothetical protein